MRRPPGIGDEIIDGVARAWVVGVLVLAVAAGCMRAPELRCTGETEGAPAAFVHGRQVTFRSGALRIRALLLVPDGRGPFPVVLWTHGSLTRDRSLKAR
jgi:hypothetical protein